MPTTKKACVAGGAGFIGSQIADQLIARDYRVLIIDDLSNGNLRNVNPRADFVKLDIRSRKLADLIIKFQPALVFHTAAQISVSKSIADPMTDAEINILGSLNLIKAAADARVKKFIFSSSGGAICSERELPGTEDCQSPASAYGTAKLAVEKYLAYYHQRFGLKYAALRYANVYGPRQNALGEGGIVAILCRKLIDNQTPVIYGHGRQTRDFVYVGDVVRANLLAARAKAAGVFNVSTNQETSINRLYAVIAAALGSSVKPRHDLTADFGVARSVLKYDLINRQMNWQPKTPLPAGIKLTAEWFLEAGNER